MKAKTKAKLFAVALLSSTALTPVKAQAAPVIIAITTVVGYITAGFTAVGTAIGLTGATLAAFATIGTQIVVGLALNAVSRALAPNPSIPEPSARMVNFAQPLTYMETVYGTVRKGGPIAYTNFAESKRYKVVILAAHEIEGITEHWLDEWPVSVDGAGVVTTSPPGSLAEIHVRLGTIGQAVLPLNSVFAELTSSHDFDGLAVAQITATKPAAKNFSANYPRGREWQYAPVIQGKNDIYDPRTDTYGWTDNAALVIADWIVNTLGRTVDWDEVATEADVCDTNVTTRYEGTIKKWTINYAFTDDIEDEQNRAMFASACDAFFYETPDGKVGFKVGRYEAPTITLTDDDFYGITVSQGTDTEAPNEFVIRYTEPNNAYREAPAGAWVVDPSGRRTREELAVYAINSHNQASRVAKRLSRARQPEYSVQGVLKYVGQDIIGQRFVRITHTQLGIDQVFEVDRLIRSEDGLQYQIEAISVESEDFDFNAAIEEPNQPAYGDVAPVVQDFTPTGITAVAETVSGVPGIRVSWDAQDPGVAHKVRYAESGTTDWTVTDFTTENTILLNPLVDGQAYDIQVQSVTDFSGRALSDWTPVTPLTRTAYINSTPPAALASFTATGGVGEATIDLTSPNDPNYYATRVYRGPTTTFGDASLIHTEYGSPNSSDSYVNSGLSAGTYYYWGEPINGSGIAGTKSGPVSATVI